MKKINKLLALLLVFSLLLCGCNGKDRAGQAMMEEFLEEAEGAMVGGELFFAGKILGMAAEDRLISYYDAEMGKNTFYSVEVTEDLFGIMPDRTITVCVLGNSETFPDRNLLIKGKEYYFHTYLWVEGEELIFLLPTFYTALPEREGEMIYATYEDTRYLCGSDEEYRQGLKAAEEKAGYGAAAVWLRAETAFAEAGRKDAKYFENLKMKVKDPVLLKQTQRAAKELAGRLEKIDKTWEGLGGVFE